MYKASCSKAKVSEVSILLCAFEFVIICLQRLVNVVGIGAVLGSFNEVTVSFTFQDNIFANFLVFFHHLDGEDVVNLNVMS